MDDKYLDPTQNPFIKVSDADGDDNEDQTESDGGAPLFDADIEAISRKIENLSQGRLEFEVDGKKIMKMEDGGFQVDGRNLGDLKFEDLTALSLLISAG